MRELKNESGTETTFYLYDREDRISDYDQSGNLLIAYTHGPGIDEPVAMTTNNSTYFYILDIQGTIRAIISADNGSLMGIQPQSISTIVLPVIPPELMRRVA